MKRDENFYIEKGILVKLPRVITLKNGWPEHTWNKGRVKFKGSPSVIIEPSIGLNPVFYDEFFAHIKEEVPKMANSTLRIIITDRIDRIKSSSIDPADYVNRIRQLITGYQTKFIDTDFGFIQDEEYLKTWIVEYVDPELLYNFKFENGKGILKFLTENEIVTSWRKYTEILLIIEYLKKEIRENSEPESENIDPIVAHRAGQKVMLLHRFDIVDYLETKFKLKKNQVWKLLEPLLGENWETLSRYYRDIENGEKQPQMDFKNNPYQAEQNQVWMTNLLNKLKITEPK